MTVFFKIIFKSLQKDKSKYKFKFLDKLIGAKIFYKGFEKLNENIISDKNNIIEMQIKNFKFFVPENVFKKGELAYIYNEVFYNPIFNPHSYEKNSVKIEQNDIVIDA